MASKAKIAQSVDGVELFEGDSVSFEYTDPDVFGLRQTGFVVQEDGRLKIRIGICTYDFLNERLRNICLVARREEWIKDYDACFKKMIDWRRSTLLETEARKITDAFHERYLGNKDLILTIEDISKTARYIKLDKMNNAGAK